MKHLLTKINSHIVEHVRKGYHWSLPRIGAVLYGNPAQHITVIAVTGTKGKSSTTELIASILRAHGEKVAVTNSVRFVIGDTVLSNTMRMSMPGRFFLQKFLSDARTAGCTYAVIEATSEGARYFRHHALQLNALVFTNLAPEHIDSHGSFEAYKNAKLSIARELTRSPERPRIMVVNGDDAHANDFLDFPTEITRTYSLKTIGTYEADDCHSSFTHKGVRVESQLPGAFNLYNILAATELADALGIPPETIGKGIADVKEIAGRAQFVREGQNFDVVVDYAHTVESLEALYTAFEPRRKIAVLGATGGGRDKSKRPRMGAMAEKHCDVVILTDEDPYDENPEEIVAQVATGLHKKPIVIMNRREAITHALTLAKPHDVILITGKGTDPCICRANGEKEPWSDYAVAQAALKEFLNIV